MQTTVAATETLFMAARNARDAADVARARGIPDAGGQADLRAEADAAESRLRAALADAPVRTALAPEDAAAMDRMEAALAAGLGLDGAGASTGAPDTVVDAISGLTEAYARAGDTLCVDGSPIGRLSILGRLATEPDRTRRRELFLALEPLWRAVDGDGLDTSPYRELVRAAAAGRTPGPWAANATALGIQAADIERWCVAILEAWSGTSASEPSIEPWDWWWLAGEADRRVGPGIPAARLLELDRAYHASLGADLDALGVAFDVAPRPGRPSIPVAFTTFGRRSPPRPWVFATYRDGGLGELTELVHETGHAIHLAGIRTRPAFVDWPDSDAFTEALAELLSLDTAEPAWLARWVDPALGAIPVAVLQRSRNADIVLDAAWALFEIRVRATPAARPNDVWTELTSRYLGIAPHREWSWWAIRGQLVQAPGYMANYAVGAVLAADIRAAIRAARGDWTGGDPGWYAWVSERLYRYGAERSSGRVVRDLLGRAPTPDALVAQIAGA
jgi:hypothetical protein